MANIILLGKGGTAGPNVVKQLKVKKEHVFRVVDGDFKKQAKTIRATVSAIDVVNWIGHGSVQNLKLIGKSLWPRTAAKFFAALEPKNKIVLWSCNTGLSLVKEELNEVLWEKYTGTEKYTKTDDFKYKITKVETNLIDKQTGKIVWDPKTKKPVKTTVDKKSLSEEYKTYMKSPPKTFNEMKVIVTKDEIADQFENSVAYQIAQSLGKVGLDVFGPVTALQPSAIKDFAGKDVPNMVQWESRNDNDPITVCQDEKWRFVAVEHGGDYKIICQCRPVDSGYAITLYNLYKDQ